MAYVPGCARGVLRVGSAAAAADSIVLLDGGEIAQLSSRPAGIIVSDGAPLAHYMIRLLGLGVPTIMLDGTRAAHLPLGQRLLIDGASGRISDAAEGDPAAPTPVPASGQALCSADGVAVQLLASVRDAAGARRAVAARAAAIGLVRSEFIAPDADAMPDAGFYTERFGTLCEAAAPLAVSIRLLDASADKRPAWLPDIAGFGGALGLQGVRLFGNPPVQGVVEAQLQAIASLAGQHPLQVIIPFLTRREELGHWAAWLRQRLPAGVSIGAMVETPAAVLEVGDWFAHADFLAVGCNDLMQTLFAADRDRPEVAAYLDPYAPLLYRLLRQLAAAAGDHIGQVRLCGLLPQLQGTLPLLLGLGFRQFSVDPPHIPYLAHGVQQLRLRDAERLATQACRAKTSAEVLALLGLPAADYQPFVT
jgi:phosphoenolpyruvate-protein kinase (PTS system EI component)